MTKQDAMSTILDELNNYAFDRDNFDGKALDTALEAFGHDGFAYEDDCGYTPDFAAAPDCFGGDVDDVKDFATALKNAVEAIDTGDYTFDPDISTTYDLGEWFFSTRPKHVTALIGTPTSTSRNSAKTLPTTRKASSPATDSSRPKSSEPLSAQKINLELGSVGKIR